MSGETRQLGYGMIGLLTTTMKTINVRMAKNNILEYRCFLAIAIPEKITERTFIDANIHKDSTR